MAKRFTQEVGMSLILGKIRGGTNTVPSPRQKRKTVTAPSSQASPDLVTLGRGNSIQESAKSLDLIPPDQVRPKTKSSFAMHCLKTASLLAGGLAAAVGGVPAAVGFGLGAAIGVGLGAGSNGIRHLDIYGSGDMDLAKGAKRGAAVGAAIGGGLGAAFGYGAIVGAGLIGTSVIGAAGIAVVCALNDDYYP